MSTTKVTINEAPGGKPGQGGNSKATGKKLRKARKQLVKAEIKQLASEIPEGRRRETKKILKKMYKKFDYERPHPQLAVSYLHEKYGSERLHEMAADLDSVTGNLVKKFAAMQMNPATMQCQVPDSDFRNSAVVVSTMVTDLEVDMTATTGGVPGQFAFLVQPKMGNFGDPHKYKIAYVDPSKMSAGDQSANDYSGPGPYKIQDSVSNTDLRVEPVFYELTQGPPGSVRFVGGSAGVSSGHPFGTTANMVPASFGANTNIRYDGTSASGTFQLPLGSFLVYTRVTGNANITAFNYDGTATAIPLEFFGTGTGTYGVLWRVNVPNASSNQFSLTITGGGTISSSSVTFATTVYDDVPTNSSAGAISAYRCAAMSTTVTPTVTAFDKGGQMAAALLPNCDANKRFFVNTPPGPEGSLRSFEAVSMLANKKGIRNFEEGLYIWWTQLSKGDYEYQDPVVMDDYEPPTFVIAGRWQPSVGSAPSGKYVIGKITTVTVYEFLTEDQSFLTQPSPGSQAIIDATHAFYYQGNDGMPFEQVLGNPEHINWWRRAVGFMKSFAATAGEVLKVAGPVLAAL